MGDIRRTRFVCISDTHNQALALPAGDVLIHAGDLTNTGSLKELQRAVAWILKQDFEVKIIVAGNHDTTLDEKFYQAEGSRIHNTELQDTAACLKLLRETPGLTYLEHEPAVITLADPARPSTTFNVFGSPHVPECGPWAFCYREDEAEELWDSIPMNTDILITHAPPRGVLDSSAKQRMSGCPELLKAASRVRPLLHVCGHIHEGRGVERHIWNSNLHGEPWRDPGAGENRRQSLVDLTGRRGRALNDKLEFNSTDDVNDEWSLFGRGRRETCVVNAAIMSRSHGDGPARLNKPIVVDINLPVKKELRLADGKSLGSPKMSRSSEAKGSQYERKAAHLQQRITIKVRVDRDGDPTCESPSCASPPTSPP